jgi:NAD(P)-dependent dehydrogenase (short-subunit alcohol dehydrogenase family)
MFLSRESTRAGVKYHPQDIADAVLYLASPLSGFVTGESLVVDGGATNTWSAVRE